MNKAARSMQPPSKISRLGILRKGDRNIPVSTSSVQASQQKKIKFFGSKSVLVCLYFSEGYDLSATYELKILKDGFVDGMEGETISISKDLNLLDPNDDLTLMSRISSACLGTQLYTLVSEFQLTDFQNIDRRWDSTTPSVGTYVLDLLEKRLTKTNKRMTSAKRYVTAIAGRGMIFALEAGVSSKADIPNPPFESFHPKTNQWESLPNAPFHDYNFMGSKDIKGPDIKGYAVVHNYILISLSIRREFYSYDIDKKEWRPVLKLDGDNYKDNEPIYGYKPFLGKAEFVDGKIFAHLCGNMVAYSVVFLKPPQDGNENDPVVGLRAPIKLEGFEIPSPSFFMGFWPSYCLTHLGNKVFCAVQTAVHSDETKSRDSQPLYISIFRVINSEDEQHEENSNSMRIETLHSTTRIINHKHRGGASLAYCFSPDWENVQTAGHLIRIKDDQKLKTTEDRSLNPRITMKQKDDYLLDHFKGSRFSLLAISE